MLDLVPYLIKLSISLGAVYLFYLMCLQRLTFYAWNRWYLLLYTMVCFIIPFVHLTALFSSPAIEDSSIVQYIPAIEKITYTHTHAWISKPAFAINLIYLVVITAGILFMLGRCLIQFYSLWQVRKQARLLYDNEVKLYHVDKPIIPFSFGNAIYINQYQHSQQELSEIIRHEFIHVKQRHSIDMIWSELLCIVNWYNPFAWLLRKAIRQNLEFIADQQVLQTGLDRKQYQYLLLKVMGTAAFSIANKFNFSSLKKRIAMMNKTKSTRVNLLRFAFILPLLAVILLAFRGVIPPRELYYPVEAPYQSMLPAPDTAYLVNDTVPDRTGSTMPDNVQIVEVKNNRAVVKLKDGKIENYNLSIAKDKKAYEDKYGPVPVPPVPPAAPKPAATLAVPAKPGAPAVVDEVVIAAPPAPAKVMAEVTIVRVAPSAPTKLALLAEPVKPEAPGAVFKAVGDDCFNKKGYCITVADNNGECVVIVKNRQMKIVEAASLHDWNSNKRYEDKYGPIPPPPPGRTRVKTVIGHPTKPTTAVIKEVKIVPVKSTKPTTQAEPVDLIDTTAQLEPEVYEKPAIKSKDEILIDQHTTAQEISSFIKKLRQKGFSLEIRDIHAGDGGLLTSVRGQLMTKQGKGMGEFWSDDLSKEKIRLTCIVDVKGHKFFSIAGPAKILTIMPKS